MNKAVYIALSGSILKVLEMEVIAQNLSNVDAVGYKRPVLSFTEYLIDMDMRPAERSMTRLSQFITDFTPGPLIRTDNPLDLAIDGSGFFVIEGGLYTRRGVFTLDNEGFLTTTDGRKVMGEGGPIRVPSADVVVTEDGDVVVDGEVVGKLKIVDFTDYSAMQRISGQYYTTTEPPSRASAQVKQGYIEGSNVNVVRQMIRMIDATREFEAFQKVIQALDEATAKVNNELGRI